MALAGSLHRRAVSNHHAGKRSALKGARSVWKGGKTVKSYLSLPASEKEMAMRRKTVQLIVMLALVLLTAPLAANAQPSPKGYRIGWLNEGRPPSGPTPSIEAFQQGLRDLGYVEGQNLAIEYRYAEGNTERLRDLAAELVGLKVDVIVTSGTPAT